MINADPLLTDGVLSIASAETLKGNCTATVEGTHHTAHLLNLCRSSFYFHTQKCNMLLQNLEMNNLQVVLVAEQEASLLCCI